jgi:hypothetical protein
VTKIKALFWRFAHSRYNGRNPSKFYERLLYIWAGMFALVWGFAFITDWSANRDSILTAFLVVVIPLGVALAMRRIRHERAKGNEALYLKRMSYNG